MLKNDIWYKEELLESFDEVYQHNGYALLNELYEDDERFYKNTWMWGRVEGDTVYDVRILDDLSSNSFAKYDEAMESFLKKLEIK
jgi:hypothetical protein